MRMYNQSSNPHGAIKRPSKKGYKAIKTLYKNWKPVHTEIVMAALQGEHADDIAYRFNYSMQTVNNILRTEKAVKIRQRVNEELFKAALAQVPDTMLQIQKVAMQNMLNTLSNPILQKNSPMALFDKSAKALEVMSKIDPNSLGIRPEAATVQQNNVQINQVFQQPGEQQALHKALSDSSRVAEIHAWISGESVDGTGTLSSTRQLPSLEAGRSDEEGVWPGRKSDPTPADQSEDGPILSLDLGAKVYKAEL